MSDTGMGKMLSLEEQAVNLLNEKYNDSFEVEIVQSNSFFRGFYTVIAYQEDNGDVLFRASVDSNGKGVSDNYVSRLVCQKLADKVAQNLDALKGVYYIYVKAMTEPSMLDNPNITIEEFMEVVPKNKFTIHVSYAPEETNAKEASEGFMNILKGMEYLSGRINLYVMDELMLAKVQEYMETHDKCYDGYQQMMKEYFAGVIYFEKGTVTSAKEEIVEMLENKL